MQNKTLSIGSITLFGSSVIPTGWLMCDGSAISRTVYAKLFSIIGTTFGAGDGSTTFNLPNLQDRFAIGVSSSKALGVTGGSTTSGAPSTNTSGSTTLTVNQIPSHTHTSHGHLSTDQYGYGYTYQCMIDNSLGTPRATNATGGGQGHTHTLSNHTHEATPPYLALNYIIKVNN